MLPWAWAPGEVQAFLAAAGGEGHRRFFAALLLSLMGLRPAEVCGLRREDADLEAETSNVANARTLSGNRRGSG
ncbi:hypothetical protein J7W19_26065 [Streptomyces mobaraensis NBRC 13819 = DSM 40847]|uniref:Integrase family protein n=1 Tax=Streptomyces mobaraensis (strain ATCC 29032 / DSM 40847 / JCM 4168 / NBRC 13819 / NCIMB 11159 / IPCR 16-22) TaxID=1223523 RepID=M3B7N7_STRM1|nr:hypothetical protein [Streptomyces mobaraensis]EMF02018.1 integrase family protein [Streptomyces mobaraensis NBRC 13819 = DSM 40847]QTT76382.1 hypothetical protein J7W19_26065 [Streptomyces mobaraensis NBRC 13819 = DSM 40847]